MSQKQQVCKKKGLVWPRQIFPATGHKHPSAVYELSIGAMAVVLHWGKQSLAHASQEAYKRKLWRVIFSLTDAALIGRRIPKLEINHAHTHAP